MYLIWNRKFADKFTNNWALISNIKYYELLSLTRGNDVFIPSKWGQKVHFIGVRQEKSEVDSKAAADLKNRWQNS